MRKHAGNNTTDRRSQRGPNKQEGGGDPLEATDMGWDPLEAGDVGWNPLEAGDEGVDAGWNLLEADDEGIGVGWNPLEAGDEGVGAERDLAGPPTEEQTLDLAWDSAGPPTEVQEQASTGPLTEELGLAPSGPSGSPTEGHWQV